MRPRQKGSRRLASIAWPGNGSVISARRAVGMREKNDAAGIKTAVAASAERPRAYFAAVTMISTLYCGAASRASTVARAGVLPGETQASHTAFISAKVLMSVM
jgi:hypothetical protein